MRPPSSVCRNCLNPSPRGPSRFSSGTRQSSKLERPRVGGVPAHLAVGLAQLVAGRAVAGRGGWRSRSLSPVMAVIVTKPEMSVPALVMNCLAPLITQSPSVELRARARVAGVRARLGLGQAERAEPRPAHSSGSHSLLLLLGAERVDRPSAEGRVRGQVIATRRVHARELLDRERVGEVVAARRRRTPRGRGCPSARARRASRRSRREALGPVELLGHRRHLAVGEVAHGARISACSSVRSKSMRRHSVSAALELELLHRDRPQRVEVGEHVCARAARRSARAAPASRRAARPPSCRPP